MTFKTIVVQLDTGAHATHRLDAAVALAERFEAHLRGVYSEFTLDPRFYYQADCAHRYDVSLADICRERRERAEHMFRERLAATKVPHDWLACEMTGGSSILHHARRADLTIVGQHDPHEADAYLADRFPEGTIMGAGGPVLVWPRNDAPRPLDATAVIAWDGSREAARAAGDALPLLRRAAHVDIVSIRADRDAPPGDGGAAPDLARSLIRHSVHVNVVELSVPRSASVEGALTSYLKSERARLLVMGAFHHGRVGEFVLGGLTRAVLREAGLPVLMSN
ncbi:universal stress protein family protein [Caballeronia calidae]|uniref:Universal stress protein family protein n=1 Tax=Caballeronia calidae TaxID=1777139 RepID=A0A158CY73_9BURK|nr:universal stress protein [Caballeronia calidae]SAK87060.1 universal stress protein family protein [Caballeronia calidae]